MITINEIMSYGPCEDYPVQRVEGLWAGREALAPREVAELEIPHEDKVWALCHCLASRDLSAVVAFSQGCAIRADAGVVAASLWAAWAEWAAWVADAADAAASAWAADASAWAADAASWAADAAASGTAPTEERQRQLDELVVALEACQ